MSERLLMNPETGETILVADDNAALLSLLCVMLKRLGYRVIAAKNGAEAVELFEKEKGAIDLLLFDVVMPKMRGSKAASLIRQQRPEIPLLFITGYADEVERQEIEHLGEYTLIPKPLAMPYLEKNIRTLLGK